MLSSERRRREAAEDHIEGDLPVAVLAPIAAANGNEPRRQVRDLDAGIHADMLPAGRVWAVDLNVEFVIWYHLGRLQHVLWWSHHLHLKLSGLL